MKKKRFSIVESGYSSGQRKGILFLMVLTFSGMYFFNWLFKPHLTEGVQVDDYRCLMDTQTVYGGYKSYSKPGGFRRKSGQMENQSRATFYFDPNTCSSDSLALLGFSPVAIRSIVNYRNKGGVLFNLEKFRHMYGVDSLHIRNLEKWIIFPEKNTGSKSVGTAGKNHKGMIKPKEKIWIELNAADSFSLTHIKGIGAFWASKIVRTRKNCGGFISMEEIKENAWLPDSIIAMINPYAYIDPSNMPQIELNEADYKTLIRQPYFDRKKVQILLKYREAHGLFHSLDDLRKIAAFDEQFLNKIRPHFFIRQ